jgi:hypothetical protein
MMLRTRHLRMVVAMLAVAATVLACSDAADPVAESEALRQQQCDQETVALAETVSFLASLHADLAAADHLAGEVPQGGPALQEALVSQAGRVAGLGCERTAIRSRLLAATTSTMLPDPIAAAVGAELAAGLLGEEPPSGIERTVTPDDDLARIVAAAPAGSVLTLAAGDHQPSETVRMVRDVELRGAGRDTTTVTVDAATSALVVQAPARVEITDLALVQAASETVAVVQLPPTGAVLEGVRITGGSIDEDGSGGSGVVITAGPEQDGVPGPLAAFGGSGLDATRLLDVEVADNAGPGIVVAGAAQPRIVRAEVRDNGICGVCYLDRASGVLIDSMVAGSEIGVLVSGTAAPRLTRTRLVGNLDAGLVLEDRAGGRYLDVRLEGNGERGVLVTDDADGWFEDLVAVDNGALGIAVTDRATAQLLRAQVTGSEHALWVESESSVVSDDGRYADSIEVAVVVRGSARLTGSGNRCEGSPFDVGLFDDAEVALIGEECRVTDER